MLTLRSNNTIITRGPHECGNCDNIGMIKSAVVTRERGERAGDSGRAD